MRDYRVFIATVLVLFAACCVQARPDVDAMTLIPSGRNLLASQFYCGKSEFGTQLKGGIFLKKVEIASDLDVPDQLQKCCDECQQTKNCKRYSLTLTSRSSTNTCELRSGAAKVKDCGKKCKYPNGAVGAQENFITSTIAPSKCSTTPGKPDATFEFTNIKSVAFEALKLKAPVLKTVSVSGKGVVEECAAACIDNYNKGGLNPVQRCRSYSFNKNTKECILHSIQVDNNPKPPKFCVDPNYDAGYLLFPKA